VTNGNGKQMAVDILNSGKAYQKMREIIEAQGGNPDVRPEDLPVGDKKEIVVASHDGYITNIDNQQIMAIGRLAGAPRDKGAGLKIMLKKGHKVNKDEPLFEIYAEHDKKLDDALTMVKRSPPITVESMLIEKMTHRPRLG
jgi:AMP phosphorylase